MSRRSSKRLILVVEDDPGDARLLCEMLQAQDPLDTELTLVESMSGAEDHLAQFGVDVILLDLHLADAEGLDAVRRAHTAAPHVPIVVISGLDDESLATQALQEGAQDYLIKGQIDAHNVLRAVGYAIERTILEDARRAGEHRLLQAQKLESVGRLAGGIAHDFNNMLFAISGHAELLAHDLASTDPKGLDRVSLAESVSAISVAAARAGALTAQLLAFSRQKPVSVAVVDLNATVTAIEPLIRGLIGEHLRLTVSLDPWAGRIVADLGQIEQIVVNLIVNARDAMPSGGTVAIETGNVEVLRAEAMSYADAAPGPYVFLEVTDSGVGMDLETLERIFEPFFTTKDVGKGTGLGLATTYGIVQQAGGHIRVRSEAGQGATFRLYFPRVEDAVETRPLAPSPTAVGEGRVMVVEDELAVREMVARLLRLAGYEVLTAAGGSEAIDLAQRSHPVDVIVTDVIMPNQSGVALAEEMMDRFPSIGVVLLSGYLPESLDLDHITERGATFVNKPVTSNDLVQAVDAAVARSRATAVTT